MTDETTEQPAECVCPEGFGVYRFNCPAHQGLPLEAEQPGKVPKQEPKSALYAIEKLRRFKDYVHKRLDDAGIPTHPEGEHSKHGCRIGDRLDIALLADRSEDCRKLFEDWHDSLFDVSARCAAKNEYGCPRDSWIQARWQTWLAAWKLKRELSFQERVAPWMQSCFGPVISADSEERNHRFLEEALELVQACGATKENCHKLVDYVYGRPVGEPSQEVGGVMVTLAALCLAQKLDMHRDGETELTRINDPAMMEKIRRKQAAKPGNRSPLPTTQVEGDQP